MTPKKPNGREHSLRVPRLPLVSVRRQIWEAALDLQRDGRSIAATLAKRFDLPAHTIEAVLLLEGAKHERTAAALRTGIANTLELAREAGGAEEFAA